MTQLLLVLLSLCAALLLPCMVAAADLRFDLRISLGARPAPDFTALPASTPETTAPPPARQASASVSASPYGAQAIRLESELARLGRALAVIAASHEAASARIASHAIRRLQSSDAPAPHRLTYTRQRLELIALGQDRAAARHASVALAGTGGR